MWDLAQLSDLTAEMFAGLSPERVAREFRSAVPVVSVGDLESGRINQASVARRVPHVDERHLTGRYLLRPGDVLLTARGATSRAALVVPSDQPLVPNHTLFVLRPKTESMGKYLYTALTTEALQRKIARLARGSTGTSAWRLQDLKALQIPLPPPEIQLAVANLMLKEEEHYSIAVEAAEARRFLTRAAIAEVIGMSSGEA